MHIAQAPHLKVMKDNMIQIFQKFSDSKIPVFKKKTGELYVRFGEKNDYPDYLLELFNKSAKHRAIINGKVKYIYGNGLASDSSDPKTMSFMKEVDKFTPQTITDIELFGGFYWQIIPTMISGVFGIHHISFKNIRTNRDCSEFYYKEDWSNYSEVQKVFPAYHPSLKCSSIFAYKEYTPYTNIYALPGYLASCNYIESDVEVSKATLTNAKTGFSAGKFINFFNGEPTTEEKRDITLRLENTTTGAEGKKVLVGFNNSTATKPTIDDLGASDLTKEDFTSVDNLITNNIFAGAEITHPILFGIQQEGKLGSSQELRIAFDIFKNTYADNKQEAYCKIVNYFGRMKGVPDEVYLQDVNPIGFEFTEATMLAVAPKSWLLEKMGINPEDYPDAAVGEVVQPQPTQPQEQQLVNEHLKNLTGKQNQQLERIIRLYNQGKYNLNQAKAMMKSGFGLSDSEVEVMLGVDSQFAKQANDELLMSLFEIHGESVDDYIIEKSKEATFDAEDEVMFQEFAPNIIQKIITKVPKFKIMYSYEKRNDASGGILIPTSRPFCKYMVNAGKVYSIQDIQKISAILGYNVYEQVGGYWNNNGVVESHCRHIWKANLVIDKKK